MVEKEGREKRRGGGGCMPWCGVVCVCLSIGRMRMKRRRQRAYLRALEVAAVVAPALVGPVEQGAEGQGRELVVGVDGPLCCVCRCVICGGVVRSRAGRHRRTNHVPVFSKSRARLRSYVVGPSHPTKRRVLPAWSWREVTPYVCVCVCVGWRAMVRSTSMPTSKARDRRRHARTTSSGWKERVAALWSRPRRRSHALVEMDGMDGMG